jgi:3-mercaptopropionate dioxygenase
MSIYGLRDFIGGVTEAVASKQSDIDKIRAIEPMLRRLLQNRSALEERFKEPLADSYAQYLVYKPEDDSFSIVSFVWLPGQSTPIHDHRVWGLIGIYEGEEEEERFKRLDNGSRPNYAELQSVGRHVARQGDISYVCPPDKDIHQVRNVSSAPSVSIHIYGCNIGQWERHIFDADRRTISPFRSGYTPLRT